MPWELRGGGGEWVAATIPQSSGCLSTWLIQTGTHSHGDSECRSNNDKACFADIKKRNTHPPYMGGTSGSEINNQTLNRSIFPLLPFTQPWLSAQGSPSHPR